MSRAWMLDQRARGFKERSAAKYPRLKLIADLIVAVVFFDQLRRRRKR